MTFTTVTKRTLVSQWTVMSSKKTMEALISLCSAFHELNIAKDLSTSVRIRLKELMFVVTKAITNSNQMLCVECLLMQTS